MSKIKKERPLPPEDFRDCGNCPRCSTALQFDNYLLNLFGQTLVSHVDENGKRNTHCPTGEEHAVETDWFAKYVLKKVSA